MDLCFFVKDQDEKYRRIDESQHQRAFDMQTLKTLLQRAGFCMIAFFGDRTLVEPTEKESRWHVVATRPKDNKQMEGNIRND